MPGPFFFEERGVLSGEALTMRNWPVQSAAERNQPWIYNAPGSWRDWALSTSKPTRLASRDTHKHDADG
jgi:hypothetical protein